MVSQYQLNKLTSGQIASIVYHDIFDYPLSHAEINKWEFYGKYRAKGRNITKRGGYYYLKGRSKLVDDREKRLKISDKKLKIAQRAAGVLSYIPFVMLVAVSGSLAMKNAKAASDIDFMVITKKGHMWTTRLLSLTILFIAGYALRRARDKQEKDKLCLNVWMSGIQSWDKKRRNAFTAHEIAQLIPLVNKKYTFEKFLHKNSWIYDYWPNAVPKSIILTKDDNTKHGVIENLLYKLQYLYMKNKITNEVIREDLALFHPYDWSYYVLGKFNG